MALTVSQNVENILKVWYKDGVENLLFRNSPVVKSINKTRVEGKQQNFAAVYGAGGAVASNFVKAKAQAAETVRNAEFQVKPGQLFSVYSMNSQEVQASLTKRGAYMKVAGNKLFASTEALRRTTALAFYGDGYGVIGKVPSGTTSIGTSGTTIEFADGSIPMKLDVGSVVQFKSDYKAADSQATAAIVSTITDNSVTFIASSAISVNENTFIQLDGSVDASGNPLLPVGLGGWLPKDRTSLSTSFFGVNRSIAPDRLAGAFVEGTAGEKYVTTIQNAIKRVRRHGSKADLIILNDDDFLKLSNEIESTNTYFTQTSTKSARKANIGLEEISASFSTNFIENIVDDPYCPKGTFYVLDKDAVELWSYTNTEYVDNGVAGNNPGKQDVLAFDNEGKANEPSRLLIDDYINVQPGEGDQNGPNVLVTLQFFGSYVVLNPSNCAVGTFAA